MRRLALIGSVITALAFSLVPGSPASAAIIIGPIVTPPPGTISVKIVTVNGSGCPKDSAAIALNDDRDAFTVSYDRYTASRGPGIADVETRKNCNINVKVTVPPGFTYAVAGLDARGFASLPAGVKGRAGNRFWFQGDPNTFSANHDFGSPTEDFLDEWQTSDRAAVASLVFGPCNAQRNLNIDTSITLMGSKTVSSFMSTDAHDGSIVTKFNLPLVWQHCPH